MAFYRGMWELMGFGYFAVFEKASGTHVADAGVMEAFREINPPVTGTLEAGWMFAAEAQGKGYAREAMRAILDWCASTNPGRPVTCIIDPRNEPSLRLAEHLGFREFARTDYNGAEAVLLWLG